ncbi:epoxide hydrolase family protein [Flavihumibacter solisilvae]|uniref:epoxide hydrolase family protein n=1 Tax=Flavihumibacter solisilvae TaxID=1349421 RepID=UPI00068BAC94|nr:epoxide hydrolase family protein [Flavihumibacter solisilvae]
MTTANKIRRSLFGGVLVAGSLLLGTVSNAQTAAADTAIRPFKVQIAESELADLKQRIIATRWTEKETVNDHSQGVPSKTVHELATYWATKYDWRKTEARLNRYPHFLTKIDGVDIHYVHVRSKEKNALPIILTHGWPGSFIELMKLIDPLTNPVAYGGKPEDAFDVVIPSMPGYGFSGKPTTTGWNPDRIAKAYVTLMKRLGYKKFLAQGGDWGSVIVDIMAVQSPNDLLGIHTNMPGAIPADIDKSAFAGAPAPSGLTPDERHAYDQVSVTYKNVYYAFFMGSRPQTLTGLADSPVGLATFLLDHDPRSMALITRTFAGQKEGLTKDDVLDNVSLYWFTNTAISAARLYWENKSNYFSPKGVTVPVAVSAFPDELYQTPRSWAEKAYPNLIYYNKLEKGGHFAAWEQPEIFTQELRNSFRSLRK